MEQPNNQFTQSIQGQQQIMARKPKKIGWIISLVAVGIGILGLVIGGIMATANNSNTIIENIEKGIDASPETSIVMPNSGSTQVSDNEGGFKYKVKKGNSFLIAFYNKEGNDVPKLIVDGKEVGAFYKADNTKVAGIDAKVKSYYLVVATNDEMTVKLDGKGSEEGVHFLIGKADLIEKVQPVIISGLIILIAFIFSVIAFVIFIVFLVIFLMKNSAYKKQI